VDIQTVGDRVKARLKKTLNVFTIWVKTSWTWLGTNKEQLTIIFAVTAGLWVLIGYRDSLDTAKRVETIRYIDRYHGDKYLAARSAINKVLFDTTKQREFFDARNSGDKSKLEKFIWSNGLVEHILSLAELYDNVVRCVGADICDKEVACTYFASDISALHNTFRFLFADIWKKMWGEDFMLRSVKFAKTCPR
jgi:hypothetical protein